MSLPRDSGPGAWSHLIHPTLPPTPAPWGVSPSAPLLRLLHSALTSLAPPLGHGGLSPHPFAL